MTGIDWQAFQDGSMPEPDRAEVRRLMASDPQVAAEWHGLQSFQRQVKVALGSDAVPMDRLENGLYSVLQQHGPRIALGPLTGMVLAGVAMTLFLYFGKGSDAASWTRLRSAEPAMSTYEVHDAAKARAWIRQFAGFDAPADLTETATLQSVSASAKRVEYHYVREGQPYDVRICRIADMVLPAAGVTFQGNTFFDCRNGVAFQKRGLAYEIVGPLREHNWEFAVAVSKRCNAVPPAAIAAPTTNSCP